MKLAISMVLVCGFAATQIGCGESSSNASNINTASVTPSSIDSARYVLADEPDGAIGVIAARESAKDGEPIVIVGRIGGAANPWIEGRAAFTLLDASKSIVAEGTDSGGEELCTGDCCDE